MSFMEDVTIVLDITVISNEGAPGTVTLTVAAPRMFGHESKAISVKLSIDQTNTLIRLMREATED